MKEFINKLVSLILEPESKFEIREETETEPSTYSIFVSEPEFGKIIGKNGRVINAIRILCRLKGMKEQKRILVKVDKLA